jgi:asparagine synthase (glutamine-hydrolysing)
MCGIAGFFSKGGVNADTGEALLRQMGDIMLHRGPDGGDVWLDADNGVGLSHRRLAIVDLSDAGRQPMQSANGRFMITFNGEIYNYASIKAELENSAGVFNWRGHSDTEVLLTAFEVWGVHTTLSKCIGMFAFALWDHKEKQLILGRDRLGEKPLYYAVFNNSLIFGSELKSLCKHPDFRRTVNKDSLVSFIRYSYVPGPATIYDNVYKLEPGSILIVPSNLADIRKEVYWSASEAIERGVRNPFTGTDQQAVEELEVLLKDAVKNQMLASDVPLGAFLSGGVDSSTIVSLMQIQSDIPVKTFSIGFGEDEYNEAQYAKAVAEHLKTDHTELYIESQQARDVIPRLPEIYDEPFADTSQIPTFLVAQLAKKDVTVALSGDAGDELFCGYNRYIKAAKYWNKLSKIPIPVRSALSHGITLVPPHIWNKFKSGSGNKLHKAARFLPSTSIENFYNNVVSQHNSVNQFFSADTRLIDSSNLTKYKLDNDIEKMMAADIETYLPDDILVKTDRAAMAVSLETRVPLLDHRVIEFAWRLPLNLKYRAGESKWILRQVLYKHVPKQLIDRPKMGFGVPLDSWLRGPLKEWAENMLDITRLHNEGYFDAKAVQLIWNEHQSGKKNHQNILWNFLMFQSWLENQK